MDTGRYSRGKTALLTAVGAVLGLAVAPTSRAQAPGGERIRQQETFTASNVLSPGTHDDWPLRARDGETVILAVRSGAFDPAVELVGPTGEVVARNDDVRQGEQNSLLLARLATGGDYQVRVRSSNAATGGGYQLAVRRFVATELPVGVRATGSLGKSLSRWHRFGADADRTLVITARAASLVPMVQVVAPNGEPVEAGPAGLAPQGSTRVVFRTPRAGDYYVRIFPADGGDPRDSYAVTVATARVLPSTIGATNPGRRIDPGGLDLWTFRGEVGDLIRVGARADSGELTARISHVPPADPTGKPRAPEGPVPPLVVLPSDPKAGGELVALLNLAGDYQVAVSQPLGLGVGYALATARPARPLADDAGSTGTLGLGGAEFWSVEGAPGRILRIEGSSDRFDAELELYGPQGDLIARDDDGGSRRDARLTALLTERGRHLVRVHSHGDGGGGPYTLRRVPDPARPLALGASGEGAVGAGGSEVWSFRGQAGQAIILSARSPDFNIQAALFDPEAAEVASDDDGGEGTDSLLSARLPVDGPYTIWIRSAAGSGRYSIQLIEAK
jgi:hypothetical protein